jgi:uncharacterized protein YecE (DUF72 family)
MKKKRLVFCTVSASNLPETIVTTESAFYLRFHGKNSIYENLYSEQELKDWAEKIKKIDAKHIFCYFNNDINANAIKNCLTLKKLLNNN